MSSQLLKDRKRFLQAAAAQPVVENKRPDAKRPKLSSAPPPKQQSGSKNFHLIAKIVNHMKSLHLSGEPRKMTVSEILEECNSQSSVPNSTKQQVEVALMNNPKLKYEEISGIYRFGYRPPIEGIKDKKSFLRHILNHHTEGLGGLMKDHVVESMPKAEKIIKYHEEKRNIVLHQRPDKKVVIFYNDKSAEIEIDETFQKLWRSVPVAQLDEEKIAEYLNKQGITSVDDPGIRKIMRPTANKRRMSKKRKFKRHNTHIENLEEYN